MTELEFRETLPHSTECMLCGADLDAQWSVAAYDQECIAVGFAKCEKCSWLRIAAAGPTEQAHEVAQRITSRLARERVK